MAEQKHAGIWKRMVSWFMHNILRIKSTSLEESVNELIKEHDLADSMHTEERVMLKNFVDFRDLKAYEVMVPRTYIISIPESANFDEMQQKFVAEGHTRIPVHKENLDEIAGFVHMKDFIPFIGNEKEFSINKVIRELIYAPRSMKVIDLLAKMRNCGIHIAIILDEYGGTDGLVTIEDLVEEIIGDIKDEHYNPDGEDVFIRTEGNCYIIDGRAEIEELEETFSLELYSDDDEFETFSGFLLSYLGRIPDVGERFEHPKGLDIEIIDADARRIKKAKVILLNRGLN